MSRRIEVTVLSAQRTEGSPSCGELDPRGKIHLPIGIANNRHLDHEQMRGWYALDEGGRSGSGGWKHVRTTWDASVAMPHGWSIAELHLLLRDSLVFEDGDCLVLLAGVPPQWLTAGEVMAVEHLPTHYGACSFRYAPAQHGAMLTLSGSAVPPAGFVLRLPATLNARALVNGHRLRSLENGDILLPSGTKHARIEFSDQR